MLTSVEGIYRNGRVELVESPSNVLEGARVIVTFVPSNTINLASNHGANSLHCFWQGTNPRLSVV